MQVATTLQRAAAATIVALLLAGPTVAQDSSPSDEAANLALNSTPDTPEKTGKPDAPSLPLFELFRKGSWLMIPIVLMSIVVIAIGIERSLGLRSSKILPDPLVTRLGQLADSNVFDPRVAYQLCAEYPSSASRVIQSMLLKVGRPHAEVEKTVEDASQRETDRLFANVRTLNLAATVTPLLGLLGTVWGMIQSFFATATLGPDGNRVQVLSEGIYVALVTTFAGLAVAIPAAMLAHFFEGRIIRRMHEVEGLAGALLPQVERYEGKLRLDRNQLERESSTDATSESKRKPTAKPHARPATNPAVS